jgi:hypothetical protein
MYPPRFLEFQFQAKNNNHSIATDDRGCALLFSRTLAMDEAREEAKEQDKKPQGLDLIAKDLEQINEDGVITKEEIVALKKEVARLRKLLKEN